MVINSDSNILVIIENRDRKLAQTFNNSSVCYKDDTLSLHNSGFGEYLDPIYPSKIEENDTTTLKYRLPTLTFTLKSNIRED